MKIDEEKMALFHQIDEEIMALLEPKGSYAVLVDDPEGTTMMGLRVTSRDRAMAMVYTFLGGVQRSVATSGDEVLSNVLLAATRALMEEFLRIDPSIEIEVAGDIGGEKLN